MTSVRLKELVYKLKMEKPEEKLEEGPVSATEDTEVIVKSCYKVIIKVQWSIINFVELNVQNDFK